MPTYTQFSATDQYASSLPGAGVRIIIYKVNDDGLSAVWIGTSLTGINASEPIELIPVEEAGNEGVDEIVTGRIGPVTANVEGIWSPKINDLLPWRGSFLGAGSGEEYVIQEVIGDGRTGEGLPVLIYEGAKIGGVSHAHGARGNKTFSLQFTAKWRYPGQPWAARTGDPSF